MKVDAYEKKRNNAQKYMELKNKELDQIGYRAYGEGIRENEKRLSVIKTNDSAQEQTMYKNFQQYLQDCERREERARNQSEQERVKALEGLENLELKIKHKQD